MLGVMSGGEGGSWEGMRSGRTTGFDCAPWAWTEAAGSSSFSVVSVPETEVNSCSLPGRLTARYQRSEIHLTLQQVANSAEMLTERSVFHKKWNES